MGSIKIVDTQQVINNVVSISQDMGEVTQIKNICGDHPIFGPFQCPDCKLLGSGYHCGKYYVHHIHRSPPGNIVIETVESDLYLHPDTKWEVMEK